MRAHSQSVPAVIRFAAIASTIACYGSPAVAQSSVTLYGTIDSGLFYQSASAASLSPKAANTGSVFAVKDGGVSPSNWGIKGTEDLGGGYQVFFRLQNGFSSTNGKSIIGDNTAPTSSIFNQMAYIGLSGSFGAVTVGRQLAPMAFAIQATDVRGAAYFGSALMAWVGMNTAAGWSLGSTNAPLGALFESNAIVYRSPTVSGFTGSLEFALGGVPGSFQANTRESVVLQYANYGLHLSALYYNGHDANPIPLTAPATGVANNRMIYFGALYDFANFSFSASYSNGRNPAESNLVDIDMYSAGVGYVFSPALTVTSGIYYLKDRHDSTNKSVMFAVVADYQLSKTTTVYAQLGHVNNQGNMTDMVAYGELAAPGTSTVAVNVGIRHQF
ncbi:porin [Paraburkholderia sp. GAS348]|uniref:porin n=1 Tax=Paraburkholderia sp. GAS348 TaxID=3035132 RepID=UPI003D19307A